MLSALYYAPQKAVRETVIILAHGFTSGKYSLDHTANYLSGRGYPCITFDFAGHKLGATGGELREMAETVLQVRAVLDWTQQNLAQKVVLVGHSMGGAASLALTSEMEREGRKLVGIVALCIGENPSQGFAGLIGKAMLDARADYVAGSPARELLTQLDSLVASIPPFHATPALFIAGKQDVLISVERVAALAHRVSPHAEVLALDTTHLEAPDKSRSTLLQWLTQHV